MSGADWGSGNGGGGLLGGFDPSALYGPGLLTPEQKQAIAQQGLLAMAGAYGQMAMPSRMPVPLGAVMGTGAAAYGQGANQAAETALKGSLLGLQGAELRAKLGMYNAAMQPPPPMYASGGGAPSGNGLLAQGQGASGNPAAGAGGMVASGLLAPGGAPGGPATGNGPSTPSLGAIGRSITTIESGNNPNAPDSSKGAVGKWQIMPSTAAQYGVSASMLRDPTINDQLGNQMLSEYAARYNGDPQAIAVAWNAGPGAADAWIKGGRDNSMLPAKTKQYLGRFNAVYSSQISGGNGAPSGSGVPSSGAPTAPPPPPRIASPSTGSEVINPGYIGWAQQQSRVLTALGMKVPDYINQAAALPMVGATEGAKKSADFTYDAALKAYQQQLDIQKSYAQWHPMVAGRPGATMFDQNTGQQIQVPQLTEGIVNGVPMRGYITPSGGFQSSGVQSGYTPGEKAGQEEVAKNTANYGSYLNPPPGQAGTPSVPAGNAGNLVPGGAANPYGIPPALQRPTSSPASTMAPGATPSATPAPTANGSAASFPSNGSGQPKIDLIRFRTEPFQTASGSVIPPLSDEYRPTDPVALKAAIPEWQKSQGEMTEAIEPSMQAEQRFTTFANMLKDVQSGSFTTHKAQYAADLKGLGLGSLANLIMSTDDVGKIQTAIHENQLSTLATLKSTTNRFTQNEFATISENQVNPDLQPAANQRILAENIAFLRRNIQLAQDWNAAAQAGWKNPDSFETAWNARNPMPASVQQASAAIGPLKGMPGNGGATPAASGNQPGASTSGPNPYRPGQAAIVQGHRYVYDGKFGTLIRAA